MAIKKKIIAIYPFGEKLHTLYNPTLELLSKKYNLLYSPKKSRRLGALTRIKRNYYLRYFYHKFLKKFISLRDISFFFKGKKEKKLKYDLLFCDNTIPPLEKNYILNIENVTALVGYNYYKLNKAEIAKALSKKSCRAIIAWNNSAKESLVKTINCKKFMRKIKVLPFAIKSDRLAKRHRHKGARLLFVSSINNPFDFELKGGLIALEVYKELNQNYQDLSFTIRANVPLRIKKKYGKLRGLKFLDKAISREEFKKLFLGSDILLEPMAGIGLLLECMNFELPAIIFNFWTISDMIVEGKSGFLIDSSPIFGDKRDMKRYLLNLYLNYLKLYKYKDEIIVKPYFEKAAKLIENKQLRLNMGRNAKKLLERKYSLEKRNRQLLSIIENSF